MTKEVMHTFTFLFLQSPKQLPIYRINAFRVFITEHRAFFVGSGKLLPSCWLQTTVYSERLVAYDASLTLRAGGNVRDADEDPCEL
jgi:hypothetical protein